MTTDFSTPGRCIERLCLSPEALKITGVQSPAGDYEQEPLSIDESVAHSVPRHAPDSKVEILLTKLAQEDGGSPDLFAEPLRRNVAKLMETIDLLNQRYGKGVVRVGVIWPEGRPWEMKREKLSQCFMTSLRDLPRTE